MLHLFITHVHYWSTSVSSSSSLFPWNLSPPFSPFHRRHQFLNHTGKIPFSIYVFLFLIQLHLLFHPLSLFIVISNIYISMYVHRYDHRDLKFLIHCILLYCFSPLDLLCKIEKKMNRCGYQQNTLMGCVGVGEIRGGDFSVSDGLVCPKPRRNGLFNEPIRPSRFLQIKYVYMPFFWSAVLISSFFFLLLIGFGVSLTVISKQRVTSWKPELNFWISSSPR